MFLCPTGGSVIAAIGLFAAGEDVYVGGLDGVDKRGRDK